MSVRQAVGRIEKCLQAAGLDLRRLLRTFRRIPRFVCDLVRYRSRAAELGKTIPLPLRRLYPVLGDAEGGAGAVGGHYFHQDLWAARRIHDLAPARHLDVGSRLDGFVAHLLSFMSVTVVDIRPLQQTIPGLRFVRADATRLACIQDGSFPSVSCLHALEHFGLGRYSDPLAPDAWRTGMNALQRVLEPGGRLFFSVPIGQERVEFNAHRVLAPTTVLAGFAGLSLQNFHAVDDDGVFRRNEDPANYVDSDFACGLFEFSKPVKT